MDTIPEEIIVKKAREIVAPLTNQDKKLTKKLSGNLAIITTLISIFAYVVLYSFKIGYCSVFNIPFENIQVNLKDYLPALVQISSVSIYLIWYILFIKVDIAFNRAMFQWMRICYGFLIIYLLLSANGFLKHVSGILSVIIVLSISFGIEFIVFIYFKLKYKKYEDVKPEDEKKAVENRSLRTIWADTDLFNYYGKEEFSYLSNEYQTIPQKKDRFWEHRETKRITRFAVKKQPMESVVENSGLKKEEIGYCYNSSSNAYVFLKSGKLRVYSLKNKQYAQKGGWNEIEISKRSRKGVEDDLRDYGRVISAFSIPKGSVMEFFDKVLLLKDSHSYVIEEEPTIRTRSFMNSIRYQDILSVTKP